MKRREFVALGIAGLTPLAVRPRPANAPHGVVVVLRGGADGLSIAVPRGDPRFARLRPRAAARARDAIDLDGYFALPAALAPLAWWWDNGSLAFAPAAGFARRLSDHAAAQARLDGWLARAGARRVPSLAAAAREIRAARAPLLRTVDSWGWDTHTDLGDQTNLRLRALATDMESFLRSVGRRADDTALVLVSEFGRSVAENAWGGTGHGHGTTVLALGGPVAGRRLWGGGRWPGLEGPELPVTAEIPALFAGLVATHTVA